MIRALLIAAAVLLTQLTPAFAQAPKPDEIWCLELFHAGEEIKPRLMTVAGNEPSVHYLRDSDKTTPSCPADTDICRSRSFQEPGDEVIATEPYNGIVCAGYISPDAKRVRGRFRARSGLLPERALVEIRLEPPSLSSWLGNWSRTEEGEIKISVGAGGKLMVKGEATFGALDPDRVRRGAINLGELEGEAAPNGNMLALGKGYDGIRPFGDDRSDCKARLRLYGRYLVVEDNLGCGGMNVSFSGIYVRLK